MNKLFILNPLSIPEEDLFNVVKGIKKLSPDDLQWKIINTGGGSFLKKLITLSGALAAPVCPRTDCANEVEGKEVFIEKLLKEIKQYGKVLVVTSYPEMEIIGSCVEVGFPCFSAKSVGGKTCYLSEFEELV